MGPNGAAETGSFGLLCLGTVLVMALGASVLIGGFVLRTAVNWYSKLTGTRRADEHDGRALPATLNVPLETALPETGVNPYASPAQMGEPPAHVSARRNETRELSFARAAGIVAVRVVITNAMGFAVGFVYGLLAPAVGQQAAQGRITDFSAAMFTSGLPVTIFSIVASFFVAALILAWMLPTTFVKACLIQLLEYLISLLLAAAVFTVVLLIWLVIAVFS